MSDRGATDSIPSSPTGDLVCHPNLHEDTLPLLGSNESNYDMVKFTGFCDEASILEGELCTEVNKEVVLCVGEDPAGDEDVYCSGEEPHTISLNITYNSCQKKETAESGTQSEFLQESDVGVQAVEEDIGCQVGGDEDHGPMPQLECMSPDTLISIGARGIPLMGDNVSFTAQKLSESIIDDIAEDNYISDMSCLRDVTTLPTTMRSHTVHDDPYALICEDGVTVEDQMDVINSENAIIINNDKETFDIASDIENGIQNVYCTMNIQHHVQEKKSDESFCGKESDDIIRPISLCGSIIPMMQGPQTDLLIQGVHEPTGKMSSVLTIPKPLLADYMPQSTSLHSKQMSALSAPFETRVGIYTAATPSDLIQEFLVPPLPMEGPHMDTYSTSDVVCLYTANPAMTSFGLELEHYVDNTLALKQEDILDRDRFIRRIDKILHETISPTCELKVHGSYKTNLALKDSDIDFLVTNYGNNQPLHVMEQMRIALYEYISDGETSARTPVSEEASGSLLKRQATSAPNAGTYVHVFEGKVFRVQSIVYTRVPVIKVVEIETGIKGDLSFGGGQHDDSMKLVQTLVERESNARYLLLFLKFFVKENSIAEGTQGGITSFVLYLMVSHFFRVKFYADDSYDEPTGNLSDLIAKRPQLNHPKHATTSSESIVQLLTKGGSSKTAAPQDVCNVLKSFLGTDEDLVKKDGCDAYDKYESKSPSRSDITVHEDDAPSEESECINLDRPGGCLSESLKGNLKPLVTPSRVLTSIDDSPEEVGIRDAQLLQQPLGMGDVLLLFCRYYAEFKYDTKAIYFNQNGESFVVDRVQKPRPQHFQMTSPFDDTYDVTSRMTCTEDFQRACRALYLFLMESKVLTISALLGSLQGNQGFMNLPPPPPHGGHHRYARGGMGGYHTNYTPFNQNNGGNQSPSSIPLHNPVAIRPGSGYGYACYPRNPIVPNMSSNAVLSHPPGPSKVPASPGQQGLHHQRTSNSTPVSSFDEGSSIENNNLDGTGTNMRHNSRSASAQFAKPSYLLHGLNAVSSTKDGAVSAIQVSGGVNVSQGSWPTNRNGAGEFSNYSTTPHVSEMASNTDPMVAMVSSTTQTGHHVVDQHMRSHASPVHGGGQHNMGTSDSVTLTNSTGGYLHPYYNQGASYPSNFYGPLGPAHHIQFHFNGGNFFTHPSQAGVGNQNYSSHGRNAVIGNQGSTNQQLGTQTPSKEPRATKGNNNVVGPIPIHPTRVRRGGGPQSSGRHDTPLRGPLANFDAFQLVNSEGGPETSGNAQRQRNNNSIHTSDLGLLDDNTRGPSAATSSSVPPQGAHTNKVNSNTSQNHHHNQQTIPRHQNCNSLYSSPPLQGQQPMLQQPPYGTYPHLYSSDYPMSNAHNNNGVLHSHHPCSYYGSVGPPTTSHHNPQQQGNPGYGIGGSQSGTSQSQHQGANSHNGPHTSGAYGGIPQGGYGQGNMGTQGRPQGSNTTSNNVLNNMRYNQHLVMHLHNTSGSNHPHQGTAIIQHQHPMHFHHLYGSPVNGGPNPRSSSEHQQHQHQLAQYAALVRSGNPFQSSAGISSDNTSALVSQQSNTNDTNVKNYGSSSQRASLSPAERESVNYVDEPLVHSSVSVSGSIPPQKTPTSKSSQWDSGQQKGPNNSVLISVTPPSTPPYSDVSVPNPSTSSGSAPHEKGKHPPPVKKGKHQEKGSVKDKRSTSASDTVSSVVTAEVESCSLSEGTKHIPAGKSISSGDPTPRCPNKTRGKGIRKEPFNTGAGSNSKQQCGVSVEDEEKTTTVGKCSSVSGKSSGTNRKSNVTRSVVDSAVLASNPNVEKGTTNNRKGNKASHQFHSGVVPTNTPASVSGSVDKNVDEVSSSVVTCANTSTTDVLSSSQVGTQLYLPPSKRPSNIKAAAEPSTDCLQP